MLFDRATLNRQGLIDTSRRALAAKKGGNTP